MKTTREGAKKAGNFLDPTAAWAKARLAEVTQILDMMRGTGTSFRNAHMGPKLDPTGRGILFLDEKHMDIFLGRPKKKARWGKSIARVNGDPDGTPLLVRLGGKHPPAAAHTKVKHPSQARFMAGFAKVRVFDKVSKKFVDRGKTIKPIFYSNLQVVRPNEYDRLVQIEIQRARHRGHNAVQIKNYTTVSNNPADYVHLPGGRIELKHGAGWKTAVRELLKSPGQLTTAPADLVEKHGFDKTRVILCDPEYLYVHDPLQV